MNKGIVVGDTYFKNVVWNKAVLWKTREISLPQSEFDKIEPLNWVVFKERPSGKPHKFSVNKILSNNTLKTVGQEEQHYWSIDLEI